MEQNKKGRKKRKKGRIQGRRAAALMFAAIIVITGILNLAVKDKLFLGKDFFMSVRASAGRLMGKQESNGVFKGKDNYLLADIAVPEDKQLEENLEAMKVYREAYPKVTFYMMLVPDTANLLSEKLPSLAVTANQKEQFKRVQKGLGDGFVWVDVQKALEKHKDEAIYYHTDSRWTTLGALYGYQELLKHMGIDASGQPELKRYAVAGDFSGGLSQISGYEPGYREPVYIYSAKNPAEDTDIVVNYVEEQKKTAALYDSGKLEEKDKYKVFLGGDFPVVDIRTTADSTERLLIVKDSFANCLVPFLAPYYREIVLVDPSIYKGTVAQVMEEYRITSVLFLYGGNTFMEDSSISGVLADGKTE
ncbi:MAG: hypothetical protein HFG95_07415 [Dorea sp.]|nr:hypothetical protein [Dorea sp.]